MNIIICDDLYLHTVRCAPIVLHPLLKWLCDTPLVIVHRQPSLPIDSELLQILDCDEINFDAFIGKMTCITDEIKATAS